MGNEPEYNFVWNFDWYKKLCKAKNVRKINFLLKSSLNETGIVDVHVVSQGGKAA